MRKITLLTIIIILSSCNEIKKSDEKENADLVLQNVLKFRDSLMNANSNQLCILKTDTFSFKGIKLGMNITQIKNIKISKYPTVVKTLDNFYNIADEFVDFQTNPNSPVSEEQIKIKYQRYFDSITKKNKNYIYYDHYSNELENIPGVKTYQITDISNYHIFNNNVNKIYLRFYNGKLFNIFITLKKSIVGEIAEKFGNVSCIKDHSISLENKMIYIYCKDDNKSGCFLSVSDNNIDNLLLLIQDLPKKKKENKNLSDF